MCKEKKSALDLMADMIMTHYFETGMCDSCPAKVNDFCNAEDIFNHDACIEQIKQYFKKQADIPDGWDVVKKQIKVLEKELGEWRKKAREWKMELKITEILVNEIRLLKRMLIEAGIEVPND